MILLAEDHLIFRLANGENILVTAESLSIELVGNSSSAGFDPEFIRDAASAVFHYFKADLGRDTVAVGEFSQALENVLRGFGLTVTRPAEIPEADLRHLAVESGTNELFFFPRLRDELRAQLRQSPRQIRFRGLRGCVKHLAGSRRWSPRCRHLEEQILAYLRQCFRAETSPPDCLLVVE